MLQHLDIMSYSPLLFASLDDPCCILRPKRRGSAIEVRGDLAPVHDPCIIKHGKTFHLFSTEADADRALEGLGAG
jgi:hypothetical protein